MPAIMRCFKTTLSIQSPKSWWYIGWRHLLTFNLDWDLNHFKQLNKSQRQQELSKEDKLNKHIFPIFNLSNCTYNVAIIDPSRREDMTLYANNVHQVLHDSVLSTRIISSDLVSVSLTQALHKSSPVQVFRGDICTMILWHSYHTNPNCFSRPKYQLHFLSFECQSRCLHF